MIHKQTPKPPSSSRRRSCFLGCFGFSGENMHPTEELNSGNRRRSWISKWKLNFKKSGVKTVPVDLTAGHRKSKAFLHAPATGDAIWEIQVVEEDASLTKKPVLVNDDRYTTEIAGERTIVLDDEPNKQISHRRKSTDSGIHRKERKTTAEAVTGAAAPTNRVSLVKESVTISNDVVSSSLKSLTHSVSLPPDKGKKPPAGGGVDDGALEKQPPGAAGFDSLIGMSIILVTLVIMMLWGKLCAILCTSAWFFIAPRLRTAGVDSGSGTEVTPRPELQNGVDLESVEYKKKVVLEGLLERKHRNVVGRL